jgi:hypothetical protein
MLGWTKRQLSKTRVFESWRHFYRPHESAEVLDTGGYCSTLGVTIPHVAAMHGERHL